MPNKVAILRAPAVNELDIVSMVFIDFDAGVKYVTEKLGRERDMVGSTKGNRTAQWNVKMNTSVEESEDNPEYFFTDYYGGNGDCYTIFIEEVDFGVPFAAFNLD